MTRETPRLDVVVVGAGVTGLATAFHLARAGLAVQVVEAASEVGGAVRSRVEDRPEGRWVVELGPNTVIDAQPAVGALIDALGLAGERLGATGAAPRRLLWKDGALHPLPTNPLAFVATPLLPAAGKLRLLAEPFVRRYRGGDEESVADFVRRRLGSAVLDSVVGPFLSGVWAGDPERLSMRWSLPGLHALEERHGGLVRGALAGLRERPPHGDRPPPSRRLVTFEDGLATLPRRLAAEVPLVTGSAARSLTRRPDGDYVVETAGTHFRAPRVVVALPAAPAAELLAGVTEGAAAGLAEVATAPVAVVAYGFRREQVAHPLDAFGFLVPRRAGLRLLGCLFPSSIFPGRAPAGHVLLTAFVGGVGDPQAAALGDDELDRVLRADLGRALGVDGDPVLRLVRRLPRAIPQYEVGHGRFVALAEAIEQRFPGLHLAGNYRDGISLPDRLEQAATVARAIVAAQR